MIGKRSAEALSQLGAAAEQLRKWRPPKRPAITAAQTSRSIWHRLGGVGRKPASERARKPVKGLGGHTRAAVDDLLKRFPTPPKPRGALLILGLLCAAAAPLLLAADTALEIPAQTLRPVERTP
jgi:hypothetical protein